MRLLSAAVRAHPERLDNLIDACKALKPVETGVVYPLSADALIGALEAARDGLIAPVLIGPVDADPRARQEGGRRPRLGQDRRRRRRRGRRRESLPDGRTRRDPGADEGQPAHRPPPPRSRAEGGEPADRAAAQPLRPDLLASLRPARHSFGRRDQHRARPRPEARHRPERDLHGACARAGAGRTWR